MTTFKRTVVCTFVSSAFLVPMLLSTQAVAQSNAAGPIKIGVVTPLSGTYAGIGQQVKWGLDLAAAQINAAGGVAGRKLELIYEDEEANPAVAT
jgi:ABC-type branched-subunit amino acid transport system substrate-binding protein